MSSNNEPKKLMSDEERQKLAEKLDTELDDFVGKMEKKEYLHGFSEDNWEEEMQQHPAFRTEPFEEGDRLPPLVEAMQQLKYDPNENKLARSYKDDGNYNFKLKKYRWAVDAYSAGIKLNCSETALNVQLLTNRAAAHYHLGNYRSALNDCEKATNLKGNHLKAIVRAAQCCFRLSHYDDAISWSDKGLGVESNEPSLLDLRSKAEQQKIIAERDRRKKRSEERKAKENDEVILKAIKNRGIRVSVQSESGSGDVLSLESLESQHPAAFGSRVHLNAIGQLVWPVLFVYPEYAQTDFVHQFQENDTFECHLSVMFGSEAGRPTWDVESKYNPESLKLYFEEDGTNLWELESKCSLGTILKHQRYLVHGGTPSFFVMVDGSQFLKSFLRKYCLKKI